VVLHVVAAGAKDPSAEFADIVDRLSGRKGYIAKENNEWRSAHNARYNEHMRIRRLMFPNAD